MRRWRLRVGWFMVAVAVLVPMVGCGGPGARRISPRARLEGHQAPVGGVVFSPDGKLMVSRDSHGMLGLWDVASGARRAFVQAHEARIWRLDHSRRGDLV